MDKTRLARLFASIEALPETHVAWIEDVIAQLSRPYDFARLPASDIVTDCVLRDLGDTLRIHHALSREAVSKDKFEYALERVLTNCGIAAKLAPRGNPGHDITIADVPVSLKTQANSSIRDDQIWISKFMELGRGDWVDASHLSGLRQRFFDHMRS